MEHDFSYCSAVEVPHTKATLTPDTFLDGLTLNYEEIEPTNVVLYALRLVGKDKKPGIDTTGMEFIPERGQL